METQFKRLLSGYNQKLFLSTCACVIFILITASVAAQESGATEIVAAARESTAEKDSFWHDPDENSGAMGRDVLKPGQCSNVVDMMEAWPTPHYWDVRRLKPRSRFKVQARHRRQGAQAFAISLEQNDPPNSSNKHKHELWIANDQRCNFGEEAWYSFSFHVKGDYPTKGSTRWVIGQWKEDSDGSPFLAQRFDNGVFHLTIQRNTKRELIATAPGDRDAEFQFYTDAFLKKLQLEKDNGREVEVMQQLQDFGPGAIDVPALSDAIINQEIDKFPFVADPESYARIEGLEITLSDNPFLPNPNLEWVDMRYRIKGDRDGKGIIEVWANDQFIVRITGKIGNDQYKGPTQYFKIGHYRDLDKSFNHSTIYFDRFKRSKRPSDVD